MLKAERNPKSEIGNSAICVVFGRSAAFMQLHSPFGKAFPCKRIHPLVTRMKRHESVTVQLNRRKHREQKSEYGAEAIFHTIEPTSLKDDINAWLGSPWQFNKISVSSVSSCSSSGLLQTNWSLTKPNCLGRRERVKRDFSVIKLSSFISGGTNLRSVCCIGAFGAIKRGSAKFRFESRQSKMV